MKATRIGWLGSAAALGAALFLGCVGCDQVDAGIVQSVSQERMQGLLTKKILKSIRSYYEIVKTYPQKN